MLYLCLSKCKQTTSNFIVRIPKHQIRGLFREYIMQADIHQFLCVLNSQRDICNVPCVHQSSHIEFSLNKLNQICILTLFALDKLRVSEPAQRSTHTAQCG